MEPIPEIDTERKTSNDKKPLLWRTAKRIIAFKSDEFREKELCDGLIFNMGDSCAFSCGFCYVEGVLSKFAKDTLDAHNKKRVKEDPKAEPLAFHQVVIRRKNALNLLYSELVDIQTGLPKHKIPGDTRVIYSSTLVDVAANKGLLEETSVACRLILEHTNWVIRLLSKSSLLHLLMKDDMQGLKKYRDRIIFGFSTGTEIDDVAKAFEKGTSSVTARVDSLRWLQKEKYRTFGMICPSLPQENYKTFSDVICERIQVDKCEHVWAEVINSRGESMPRTLADLKGKPELKTQAELMEAVMKDSGAWEEYARATFLAHTKNIPASKLRFLQYVETDTKAWWEEQTDRGAVPIGTAAGGKMVNRLEPEDRKFLARQSKIVTEGARASIAASEALWSIHDYRGGILWKPYGSFEAFCIEKWDYARSHAYRLRACGQFIRDLKTLPSSRSPKGEYMPVAETHVRPVIELVPDDHQVVCWKEVTSAIPPREMSAKLVRREVGKYLKTHGLERKGAVERVELTEEQKADDVMSELWTAIKRFRNPTKFHEPLERVEALIKEEGKIIRAEAAALASAAALAPVVSGGNGAAAAG